MHELSGWLKMKKKKKLPWEMQQEQGFIILDICNIFFIPRVNQI